MNFAVILGSGLDKIDILLKDIKTLKAAEKGVHTKRIFTGRNSDGVKILFFCGRKHYYEGYDYSELTENISFAKKMGIRFLMITNAAGGINSDYKVSDLMLIDSYINFNTELSRYKKNIIKNGLYERVVSIARNPGIRIHRGNYGYFSGPVYETQSEVRFLKKIGIDAVGMSTVPEISEARNNNIEAVSMSVITNVLHGNIINTPNHSDILKAANGAINNVYLIADKLANELKNC